MVRNAGGHCSLAGAHCGEGEAGLDPKAELSGSAALPVLSYQAHYLSKASLLYVDVCLSQPQDSDNKLALQIPKIIGCSSLAS